MVSFLWLLLCTVPEALQCERDYGLTAKAIETNWVIVYPEGVPRPGPFEIRTWKAGTCCDYAVANNVDDVGFIRLVIGEMVRTYKKINN